MSYPKKYRTLLDPGEKVIWFGKRLKRDESSAHNAAYVFFFGAGMCFVFFCFSWNWLILIFALFMVVFGFMAFNIPDEDVFYLATNERVILDDNPRSKFDIKSTYYSRIHRVSQKKMMGNDCIVFQMRPDSLESSGQDVRFINYFNRIPQSERAFNIIYNAWEKKSPYSRISDAITEVANQYGLEVLPFHDQEEGVLKISDVLDGMQVELRLHQLHDLEKYTIIITCPNSEDNHLGVSREGFGTSFNKLLGTQDLQIGDRDFDRTFLLQSDNELFFNKVLTQEVQNLMMKASADWNWNMTFGSRKDTSKTTSKKDTIEGILDAHLMDENADKKKRKEGLENQLEFACTDVIQSFKDYDIIAERCATAFEMMIQLAKNIQAYEKRNN